MFKRNLLGLGWIRSDEGFSVYYGNKTLYYTDQRGTLQIGYEDHLLFPSSLSGFASSRELSDADRELILDRMLRALEWDGHPARLRTSPSTANGSNPEIGLCPSSPIRPKRID